ncbi:meiosis-specific protein ASY2-like [Brassica napus]|nr:meiosis-specific protein ASY2-like [Brassica napus]
MDHPKEGSGESGMPPSASGAKLLKVKQEVGAKMRKGKKTAREAIATRVSKRKKKDDSSGSSPHSPSLLKNQDVVNLMVQALGQKELGRACNSDETPETAPEGWFCCHEKYISKSHLRFPLPTLLLDLLDHYQLALSQLCPSVIRVINGFITRSKEEGVSVGLTELMSLFSLKESASKEGGTGTYYLPSRPNHVIFRFSSSDDDWRKKYFYVKVDPSTVPVGRNLRVTWTNPSEIEDPPKLSTKLTRALYRKLQQSPYSQIPTTPLSKIPFLLRTLRVSSCPNLFNDFIALKFLNLRISIVPVSAGDSVVSISTGASASGTEKSQPGDMTLRPSFRSRGNPSKAASASRGSDRNQGGSFLISMKEVLDDGGSKPVVETTPTEVVAQDAAPLPEVQVPEADYQAPKGTSEVEPSRHKRPRTDQGGAPTRSSSSSSRGGTVGWSFTHSKPGSILDDSWGLAAIMRHLKSVGCPLPALKDLTNRDEYLDIAHCMGQLAGAVNRAQLRFENALCAAPNAGELAEVTEMVKAAKADLDQARVRISELEAEVTRLGSKADAQQGEIESQKLDIQVKSRRINDLEAARKIAEHQVRELIASSQDSQKNKEAEVKLAVREGKKEVAEAYGKILVCVKEKFARKKDEVNALVYAQELQANADLLKDMLNNKIQSVEEEYNQLVALLPEATTAYEKAQVSDFSVSKLPLPQISESSAPVEAAIGGDGNVVDEGVPAGAGDPIQEEKED